VITSVSSIRFRYYWMWRKLEYPERTTDHGKATGKLYHMRLRVECTLFCILQCGIFYLILLLFKLKQTTSVNWSGH